MQIFKTIGVIAAGVSAAAHTFLGTFDVLLPFLQSDAPTLIKGTLHACWHFVTLFLVYGTVCFAKEWPNAVHLAWLWIGFAASFIGVAFVTSGLAGLLVLPQWTILGLAGVMMVCHLRRPQLR